MQTIIYTVSGQKDLQSFVNNFNKVKRIFIFLVHIIPMIRFTKNMQNLISKFTYHEVVLT